MSPLDVAAAFWSRLQALSQYALLDGEIPASPERPYVLFWAASATPTERRLTGRAGELRLTERFVCVSNHRAGAVKVASDVADLFDGWLCSGALVEVSVFDPLSAPDMQAGYRWSVTVEASLSLSR